MKHIKGFKIFENTDRGYYLIVKHLTDTTTSCKCGSRLSKNSKFCGDCGQKVERNHKAFIDGKYSDGSTLLIPYKSKSDMFSDYDSKPIIYSSMEEAQKRKDFLMSRGDNIDVTIEKL